jgi:hypothetical protein
VSGQARRSTHEARTRQDTEIQERAAPALSADPAPGDADLYVLYRAPGAARYPFLAAWIQRHRLTAGFLADHARRFRQVLVVGPPDGLMLADTCRVVYVHAEAADRLFAADPSPQGLFGGTRGRDTGGTKAPTRGDPTVSEEE